MAAQNNIVGEVGLKVVPVDPAAQFQAGVDQIIKKLEAQAKFQVQASGLDKVQDQANQAGQAFANAAIQAAGLTAAIYGIRASIEGAVGKLSGLFDQLAQARAGFTSILKSEEAGGKLLDDIREFARVSPFVTQELVNYSQQLLGVGLAAKEIIPLLRSTGDIISSVGGDTQNLSRVLFTLTQIKSIGVLKGQDTMQLQNSLIPITKYLSEYLHKSAQEIVKLREAGLITADTVFNALNQQGAKVQGAMDAATRNISGARAILSDTITQLFQDQPVLNKIFEDVFKSIQALANKLGEAEFQQAFAQFFDGVNKVYEGLKPVLTELAKVGESGAITGLKLLGSALSVVAGALNALEPVLPIITRFVAAFALIKAPTLLITYITSLRTLASNILPATANMAKFGAAQAAVAKSTVSATAALQAENAAIATNTGFWKANAAAAAAASAPKVPRGGRLGALVSKYPAAGTFAAVGATVAGGYLSGQDSTGAQTAGGALQGAGTGYLVGGPVGAAAGALIGGTLAFFAAQDAAYKKRVEESKKKGAEAAQAFIDANNKAFGEAPTGNSFRAINDEIDAVSAKLNEVSKKIITFRGQQVQSVDNGPETQGVRQQLTDLQALQAATFDPIEQALADLVGNLTEGSAAFQAFTNPGRGAGKSVVVSIDEAEAALARYGFTLDDLNSPEKREQLAQYIPVFDGLTTAEQNATAAATKLNTALKTARETVSQMYDPVQTRISDQIAKLALSQSVVTAAFAAGSDKDNQTKQLEFQLAASKAAEDARARQLAQDNLLLANLKQRQALERQAGDGRDAAALADRQADEVAAFNEAAAIRQATAAKEEETRATLLLNAAIQSTSRQRFAFSDAQIKQQEKLLGLQDTQQNREIITNVTGAAIAKLDESTKAYAANYDQRKKVADQYGREIPTLEEAAAANGRLADVIAGKVTPATSYERKVLKDVTDEMLRQTKAVTDAISPWQNYIDQFDRLKGTGDLLGSLFEVNDDNAVVLNATAENIGNVFRQLAAQADAIFDREFQGGATRFEAEKVAAADLAAQLELVQLTLGQTDAEFAATLATAGLIQPTFSGFAGTFEQVAQQMGIPKDVLQEILDITGKIPTDMNLVVTADAAQAIAELERLRKVYLSDPVLSTLLGGVSEADRKAFNDYLAGNIPKGGVAFGAADKPTPGKGAADTAAKDAEALAARIKAATDALADKLEAAAESIADAAKSWVTSIKERTQYEQAVSAGTAIRNTQRQIKDLTELTAGLAQLRAQGLTQEAIESLGIDNVADVRQVRKLLKANPGDITALSSSIAQLNEKALTLATSEEDKRTQKNISEGILAAAEALEIDFTKPQAAALAGEFHITSTSNADEIAAAIIAALSSGRTGR